MNGPSVHLARELARCWGNLDYGFGELRRDDEARQSEIRAWAWDQETNTRSSSTFIVPHARDKGGKPQPLIELRDIYLNNNNESARRVREAIFAVLPDEYIEEAKTLCQATLNEGGGRPIEERAAAAVDAFAALGVTQDQLEAKLLRPLAQWDGRDLGHLTVIRNSINRGEIVVADEFPPRQVTTAELAAQAAEDQADADAEAGPEPDAEPAPGPAAEADQVDVEPWDRPAPGPPAAAPAEPDPEPEADSDPVTYAQLVAAGRPQHWGATTGAGIVWKRISTLAAEHCGATFANPDELVADQAAAALLLAKLTEAS